MWTLGRQYITIYCTVAQHWNVKVQTTYGTTYSHYDYLTLPLQLFLESIWCHTNIQTYMHAYIYIYKYSTERYTYSKGLYLWTCPSLCLWPGERCGRWGPWICCRCPPAPSWREGCPRRPWTEGPSANPSYGRPRWARPCEVWTHKYTLTTALSHWCCFFNTFFSGADLVFGLFSGFTRGSWHVHFL